MRLKYEPDIPTYEAKTEPDIPTYEAKTEPDIPTYEAKTEPDRDRGLIPVIPRVIIYKQFFNTIIAYYKPRKT